MRIISGSLKGRKIDFPPQIRPTQDKVRHAVFNVLVHVVEDARVLDLFAGSGAFGLEALSRGAKHVVFIDKDKGCVDTIGHNIDGLDLKGVSEVYVQDAQRAVEILAKRERVFDLIFVDPPYYQEMAKKSLKTIEGSGILATRGFLVFEHALRDDLPDSSGRLSCFRRARYGNKVISYYSAQK